MKIFELQIPDEMLADRQMSREKYYAVRKYLRYMSSLINNLIDHDKLHKKLTELVLYGQAEINPLELLRL